jgi:hypothetical protein
MKRPSDEDQKKWNGILKGEGLSAKLPRRPKGDSPATTPTPVRPDTGPRRRLADKWSRTTRTVTKVAKELREVATEKLEGRLPRTQRPAEGLGPQPRPPDNAPTFTVERRKKIDKPRSDK